MASDTACTSRIERSGDTKINVVISRETCFSDFTSNVNPHIN